MPIWPDDLQRRQGEAGLAFLERAPGGVGGFTRSRVAVQHRGHRVGQSFLGVVDLAPLEALQPLYFVERNIGEQAQELADVGVVRVPPILPEIIGAELVRVEPYGPGFRLPHLLAVGGRQQRRRHAEQLLAVDPAAKLDAVDDVAPLIRSAELEDAARAPRQLEEIIGLKDHVVEFEEESDCSRSRRA
jgi:hypothetical protein